MLSAAAFAGQHLPGPGRRPRRFRARYPGQPSRPRLRRRAVLQHRVGHRSRRQQAARRHPAGRSAAGEFQPALQGAAAGARHGLLARPPAPSRWSRSARTPSPSSTRRPMRSSTSPMSAARRTRPSSRRTARRSGSRCAARTTSPCSTARLMRRRRASSSPNGPGMPIFSPDGKYGYVCSSFNPETVVISVADHKIVGRVQQASPFCPNIAATPDGTQVWFTLKDIGKTQVFDAQAAFHRCSRPSTPARSPTTSTSCATRNGTVRLCHRRRAERGAGVPHRRFQQGRDDPGRQAAARHLAVGRRHARLCRAGERRRAGRDRHADQHGDRDGPDRPGAAGDRLCAGRGARGRRHAQSLQPLGARRAQRARISTLVPVGATARRPRPAPPASRCSTRGWCRSCRRPSPGSSRSSPMCSRWRAARTAPAHSSHWPAFMTNPAGAAIVNAVGPIRQIVQGEARRAAPLSGHRPRVRNGSRADPCKFRVPRSSFISIGTEQRRTTTLCKLKA